METYDHAVEMVKNSLKSELSPTAYNLWISPIELVSFHNSTFILCVQNNLQKDVVINQYNRRICNAFHDILGFDVSLKIITEIEKEKINDYIQNNNLNELPSNFDEISQNLQDTINEISIDKEYEYTFDTFIVGSSNTFAYAACKAVAQSKSSSYNPLFIYGPSGLGKTHLLMSIKHERQNRNPNINIMYVNSETFTNEFISSVEQEKMRDFRAKYRSVDVLLVDDIQFLSGKTQTQEEFFYTFNEIHQSGKQIVLTSDRPPKDIKTLEERLRTRFEWGLLVDISPPEFETRVAIIHRKSKLINIEIPDEVSAYIAKNLKNNIRQLEGAVKKIKAAKLLTGASPSIEVAQTAIKEVLNDNQPPPVTVERIIKEISTTFGVSESDIRSIKRQAQISKARHMAIFIVREITQMSYDEIGKEFSNRDHSTITYSLRQAELLLKKDKKQKEIVDDIINNIR